VVYAAFHDVDIDTDTDIVADILARMSVSLSASWNAGFMQPATLLNSVSTLSGIHRPTGVSSLRVGR